MNSANICVHMCVHVHVNMTNILRSLSRQRTGTDFGITILLFKHQTISFFFFFNLQALLSKLN